MLNVNKVVVKKKQPTKHWHSRNEKKNKIKTKDRDIQSSKPVARQLAWHNEKRFMRIKTKSHTCTHTIEQWKSSPQNHEHKSSSSHSIVLRIRTRTKRRQKRTQQQHVKYLFRTTFFFFYSPLLFWLRFNFAECVWVSFWFFFFLYFFSKAEIRWHVQM